MSWPLVKLGNVCERVSVGHVGITSEYYTDHTGIPFLRTQNLNADGIVLNDVKYITQEFHSALKKSTLASGDVVLSRVVSTSINCGIVPDYLDGANCANIILARPNKTKLDAAYLIHYIRSSDVQRSLLKRQVGSAQSVVNTAVLKSWPIPLPPLEEQKRIAVILDKADAIRRKREQAIKLADDFLRSVFLEMFGDPVTNPKGFKKVPITELTDVITGFAFKSNGYIGDSPDAVRLCRGTNTLTGYLDWSDTAYWSKNKLEKLEGYLIKAGDIILAMDRPWISSGLKVCVFPENQRETYLVQRVARLRPRRESYTDYIYSCIKSLAFENHCCPTETTVPHISPVELKNFEVLLPNPELIEKYHSVVSVINSSVKQMTKGKSISEDMFASLSQKAFSGK